MKLHHTHSVGASPWPLDFQNKKGVWQWWDWTRWHHVPIYRQKDSPWNVFGITSYNLHGPEFSHNEDVSDLEAFIDHSHLQQDNTDGDTATNAFSKSPKTKKQDSSMDNSLLTFVKTLTKQIDIAPRDSGLKRDTVLDLQDKLICSCTNCTNCIWRLAIQKSAVLHLKSTTNWRSIQVEDRLQHSQSISSIRVLLLTVFACLVFAFERQWNNSKLKP